MPEELVRLARRCLVADGGLPLAGDAEFLRRRWGGVGAVRFGRRGSSGELVAAGVVCPGADGPVLTGLVDPAVRGCGVGGRLLDHGLALAGSLSGGGVTVGTGTAGTGTGGSGAVGTGTSGSGTGGSVAGGSGTAGSASGRSATCGSVTVETESLTSGAAALFGSRGLRQVFAEDVLWLDLGWFDGRPCWPAGAEVVSWSADVAERFFAVYEASFRGRPGYPGPSADEWVAGNEADDDFRPGWSLLACLPGIGDAGFLTAAVGWVVQVGVVPAGRRRGLGRALVTEALGRMAAAGEPEAWLTVNVNNPAAARLYRDLGFTTHGRRARYQR